MRMLFYPRLGDGLGRAFPHTDAVRNTDTLVRVAGELEPRYGGCARLDFREPLRVADGILCHRAGPAEDTPEQRLGGESNNVMRLAQNGGGYRIVAFRKD